MRLHIECCLSLKRVVNGTYSNYLMTIFLSFHSFSVALLLYAIWMPCIYYVHQIVVLTPIKYTIIPSCYYNYLLSLLSVFSLAHLACWRKKRKHIYYFKLWLLTVVHEVKQEKQKRSREEPRNRAESTYYFPLQPWKAYIIYHPL